MDRNTNLQNQSTEKSSTEQASLNSSTRPLSIEPPRSSYNDNQIEVLPNQPRQPADLQGLLRFAMEATKVEDAPNESNFYPIDDERKRFLDEALSSMSVNITDELQKDVKLLKNIMDLREEDDPSEYEAALDRVTDWADSMDMANDFYKIGGFSIFGICLNSSHNGIRWRVANLIAELTQNNSYCQEKVLEAGYMPILLNMIDSDTSELSRIKALYAVSCIVRGCAIGLRHMEVNDGFSVLIRTMQSPIQKLQIKSAFLLSSLCTKDKDNGLKLSLIKMGLIEQACGLLAMSSLLPETREQLLNVLNGLVNDNYYPALKECRRPELCLKQTLDRHLQESKAENCIDTESICNELLDKVFADVELELER
ncbi:PREDICTED: hsp70-binding protein 1-like [Ceratosolen solmsi marchali]|uniref:Hsp70-binding protein 1-like n=1 Tax=Ceratosolen solmsi marchali TaxID=326594 RepID=A0AAJ6YJQ7_9HYME|nr:PREDICTED: hsp70-binding protein 1-like [Ceratosolen solmsi marchali]